MPPWSAAVEVDRLAETGAEVDFVIPLVELTGLRAMRGGVAGSVAGRVRFSRAQGASVAELTLSGMATLECQRCLQPLELALSAASRVALVGSEAQGERVPADLEPVLAPGGRISIGELVTQELLLTLPIVPLHAGLATCAAEVAPAPAGQTRAAAHETHKPFERLAELMKR